ncbi:MAG: pantothenate kinase [Bacteroidetes bacterium RIFCSPLOWO2_12_FULL_35_15]|nr:MAG: pantothenate kinase [Bacteroidetes bacterium RIFCSPLOWO2_12_FULL_35_15]
MQLVIDIGNTRVKAALFEKNDLKTNYVFKTPDELLSANLFETNSISHCMVASVVNEMDAFVSRLKEKTSVLLFTSETAVPIKNKYQSVQTLGSDRLASAVGGNAAFPDKNVLVIDAGTCIKYNFVNNQNEYIGGAISPGLEMRFKALQTFTARLPLIEKDEDFEMLIGKNTRESILSGVEIGVVAEMEGIISRYQQLYPDLFTVLTGGDVNFFEKRLKKPIFADQFLILKGLNVILDYTINA